MIIEHLGLSQINGSLIVLDNIKDASYDEMVELPLKTAPQERDVSFKLRVKKSLFRCLRVQRVFRSSTQRRE